MGKRCCCRSSVTLLLLASLLLIAAIATPGWSVVVKGNSETLASVFYRARCAMHHTVSNSTETKCVVQSYMTLYKQERDDLTAGGVTKTALARFDNEYHVLVLGQVLIVTSAALSVLVFILQASRGGSFDRSHVRLIISSIVISAIVVGILLTILAQEVVDQAYQHKLLSLDHDRDHTFLGFPYSLVLVFGSALLHGIAIVTMGAHLYTPKQGRKNQKRRLSDSYVEYNNEPALETKVAKHEYDNPIISEKL